MNDVRVGEVKLYVYLRDTKLLYMQVSALFAKTSLRVGINYVYTYRGCTRTAVFFFSTSTSNTP